MFQAEELMRQLKPVRSNQTDSVWNAYLASDEKGRQQLLQASEIMNAQEIDTYEQERVILKPPQKMEELYGDYPVGMVIYADKACYPFAFQQWELTQHIGVFGRTGAGKSYLMRGLLKTHLFYKRPVLIFDWKTTYRDMKGMTHCVPGSDEHPFSFNPFMVGGLPQQVQKACMAQIVELFLDSYLEDLQLLTVQGVEALLLRSIDHLIKEQKRVTFGKIFDFLHKYQGSMREMDWRTSALNMVSKVVNGPLGRVVERDCDIELLSHSQTVFSLGALSGAKDRSFLIRSILLHLFYYAQGQGATKNLKLLVVIEEAHQVLLRKKDGKESVIEMMLRMAREYGIGICLVDQHPSRMSYPALGTYATVAFALKLRQDREAMASALNLSDTEVLGRLPRQYAIIKLSDRFLTPFLIRTFDEQTSSAVPVHLQEVVAAVERLKGSRRLGKAAYRAIRPGSIDSEKVKTGQEEKDGAWMEMYAGLQSTFAREKEEKGSEGSEGVFGSKKMGLREEQENEKLDDMNKGLSSPSFVSPGGGQGSDEIIRVMRDAGISRQERGPLRPPELLLCHFYVCPLKATLEHYTVLGWSTYQGNRWRRWLKENGLIVSESVATKTGRIKRPRPTKKGFRWLQNKGFGLQKQMGLEHRYWQRRIAMQCQKMGYVVQEEYLLKHKEAVDVMVKNKKKKVAIEIETGSNPYAQMVKNIQKCVGQFDGVISLMLSPEKVIEVKKMIREGILTTEEYDCLYHIRRILGEDA